MSSQPSAIEATKFFDWVLKHPGRKACFGDASDLDIVMHCDKMLRSEDSELFILEKSENEPLLALWCELDNVRKNIHIVNILGDRGSLMNAVGAWNALYPGWTVSGARTKSKKNVQYKLSDFLKS